MKKVNKIIFSADKEKLTEKAFTRSIAVSVLSIVFCVIALCSTTWAWYSENISSTSNMVYAANCDMSISVQMTDGESYSSVEPVDGKYQLNKDITYKISLKAVGNANSAYAIINYNGVSYYTDQFEVFSDSSTAEEFTFILSFSEENTSIEIYPCWGTSSRRVRDVYNGKSYSDLREITKAALTTKAETTQQAPQTTVPPVTTAPVTTEAPATTAPATTETPVTTVLVTTETPVTTAPVTTETPVTTVPVMTDTPVNTAPVTTEIPATIAPATTETPTTTAPVTTETPQATMQDTTQTPETQTTE